MESLFGAIPTESHAAPAAGLSAGPVKEKQRARRFFTRFYPGKILGSKEIRNRVGNRQKQRIRRTPAAQGTPLECRGGRPICRID